MALEPGIYFGLPEEDYFKDSALSRSNLLDLLDTPNTFWKNSWMNPARDAKRISDPMAYGSAFDCALFEPSLFFHRYRIGEIDFHADNKKFISKADYDAIIASIRVLKKGKDSTLFLTGGIPQVTIIFDDNGIRYRTRHDYFTPVLTDDFKTTYTLDEHHLKQAFRRYGYDIQLYLYRRSRKRFKEQYAAGEAHVFGSVNKEFFEAFLADQMDEFIFIFQRSRDPYPFLPLFPSEDTENSGFDRVYKAVGIYQKNLAEYGTKEWPVCEGKVKEFSMYYGIKEEN